VAPPIVLATVTVLRQDIDSPDARELAHRVETLEAFNPMVTTHLRPLGRMNRARVIAYGRSAKHRGAGPPAHEAARTATGEDPTQSGR
jgi:hypothetical protein